MTVMIIAAVAATISFLVYLPALSCGFINFDDPIHIINNPLITGLNLSRLIDMLTKGHKGGWLPLTYLSFAVDYKIWGLNPYGYHLSNIILHSLNTGLVVLLANSLCRGRLDLSKAGSHQEFYYLAMLLSAALLFGIHPLRVGSVTWISDRKSLLNTLFFLLSLKYYLQYVENRNAEAPLCGYRAHYILSVAFFALSLSAKQASVTMPVVLLILDYAIFNRFSRKNIYSLIMEKTPFAAIAALATFVAILMASDDKQIVPFASIPLIERFVISGNALFEYVRFFILPFNINPYVVLANPIPLNYVVACSIVLLITLYAAFIARTDKLPTVTWLNFLIMMSPMLYFIHVGEDIAYETHYTYLPSIIPGVVISAALFRLIAGTKRHWVQKLAAVSIIVVFVGYAGVTVKLIPVWKDTGTFWSRVIKIDPVGRAYGDRGVFYLLKGRNSEALNDFTSAIAIAESAGYGKKYNLYAFRGVVLQDLGRPAEAVTDLNMAISLFPHPTYYMHRSMAWKALGKSVEAEEDLRMAGAAPPPIDWF